MNPVPGSAPGTGSCPTPSGIGVTLTQSGSGFTLSNGLVTVSINSAGQVTQAAIGGHNLMGSGDTLYISENGGNSYYAINASTQTVVRNTEDTVELSFKDTSGSPHDMNWDLHYVVRRGVSGFYYFLIADTIGLPNVSLGELRSVQRFNAAILSNGYNGERHGQLPNAAQNASFTSANQIQDTTWPLPNGAVLTGTPYSEGPVYSKYDWATYRTEDLLHGLYGNGYGAWLFSASWEYYGGGSVKQELMVHQNNLILNMYQGAHFGSNALPAGPNNWQKLYGPNLVYLNAGIDAAVISDAQAAAAVDRQQWPYCWMSSSLYPLAAGRATVTGKLVEAHGQSTAGAVVKLAEAAALLQQGYGFMYWAQADGNGSFTIPNVRPGTYALHVYATQGTIVVDPSRGEIVSPSLTVLAGANDLGSVIWSPPYHANLLWAIGQSDQTSGEFRFNPAVAAGPNNTGAHTGRMYGPDAAHGVWTVPPSNTTYTVGTSTPDSDWYFAQGVDGTWTVAFNLASVPAAGAFLTIGIAGAARNAQLGVGVNGHSIMSQRFGNDQSLYRDALEGGAFQMITAPIPAGDLRAGANSATFTLSTNGSAGAGIYYDIIKLESD
jgi:rhamnogalacturonan endolyase